MDITNSNVADNKNMISTKALARIKSMVIDRDTLEDCLISYLQSEPNTAEDIEELMDGSIRLIMTLIAPVTEEGIQNIEGVLELATTYDAISAFVRCVFASGLVYGSARSEDDFERYWSAAFRDLERPGSNGIDLRDIF